MWEKNPIVRDALGEHFLEKHIEGKELEWMRSNRQLQIGKSRTP